MSKNILSTVISNKNARICTYLLIGIIVGNVTCKASSDSLRTVSKLKLIWSDEFDGIANAKPADHWFYFDGWGSNKWRDTYYTKTDVFLDGSGHLVLQGRIGEDDKFFTSYIQTYNEKIPQSQWTVFGPSDKPGKKKYIEARINLEEFKGYGPWCAFWLFDPSDTYDNDPSNGTEIDIFEYVSGPGKITSFNVANHWGKPDTTYGHEGLFLNGADKGIDISKGWHTFGLEWYRDKLIYYCDNIEVWRTSNGVATGNGQSIILSIEYDAPPKDAWGINQNVLDNRKNFPTKFVVDYVRVYEEK